ncbi:hypothetical protein ABTC40_22145, partial [Acinetobacter baumannii]
HNAEYLERFAMVHEALALPEAEILPPGPPLALDLNGVHVPVELQVRLRRTTRAKALRIGAGMLRYRRGRTAPMEAALWQS